MTNYPDSPLLLAYLGDAVMEGLVRRYLISRCKDSAVCNRMALEFVTAKSQSEAVRRGIDYFTEEERSIFVRAKNAKASAPRNIDLYSYRLATGLEAVFGYNAVLDREERNRELFEKLYLQVLQEKND